MVNTQLKITRHVENSFLFQIVRQWHFFIFTIILPRSENFIWFKNWFHYLRLREKYMLYFEFSLKLLLASCAVLSIVFFSWATPSRETSNLQYNIVPSKGNFNTSYCQKTWKPFRCMKSLGLECQPSSLQTFSQTHQNLSCRLTSNFLMDSPQTFLQTHLKLCHPLTSNFLTDSPQTLPWTCLKLFCRFTSNFVAYSPQTFSQIHFKLFHILTSNFLTDSPQTFTWVRKCLCHRAHNEGLPTSWD